MITKPIAYTKAEKNLIFTKLTDPSLSRKTWSDEDLLTLKKRIKQYYLKQQKHTCPYCQQIIKSKHGRYWDIEHIIPLAEVKNFMFEPENLCASCIECNQAKKNKKTTNSAAKKHLPLKSENYLIVHPHFDEYSNYILVIRAGFFYYPKNEKGEKTIELCRLNRFYKFAGYPSLIDGDKMILILADELSQTDDEEIKHAIRNEIILLAIQNNIEEID